MQDEELDKAFELGKHNKKTCSGCVQSTVAKLLEVLEKHSESDFMAASGRVDGLGLTGDDWRGGLTGGTIVVGLLLGRTFKVLRKLSLC